MTEKHHRINNGYILLYRSILDNPMVCSDTEYFTIWIYLLLLATHTERTVMFNGESITLLPGQLITSRKSISERFKINDSKVDRVLKRYENEQQIEQQTCSKNRLISIRNWGYYQNLAQQNEIKTSTKRTTDEHQLSTNNNENTYNKGRKVNSRSSECKSHGYFKNVLLTEKEYSDLLEKNLIDLIEDLSNYIESKGVKYKNHYATILSWSKKRKPKLYERTSIILKDEFEIRPTILVSGNGDLVTKKS